MKRRILLFGGIAAIVGAGAMLFYRMQVSEGDRLKAPGAKDYATLDASLEKFVSDFNAAAGSVRMVFVVGPSCGPCLRGLDDMNRVLGERTRTDPDLKAFVLYVPTLGAREENAARAVRLMQGPGVRHYWDPNGESGAVIEKALGIEVYAWDVWLVYGPDAKWTNDDPPTPVYWEHQLSGLPRDNFLNPKRFAKRVALLLQAPRRR